ncbi:hypothetical protein HK096_001176, partial [Nowakowskiella sp. JEL0078]
MNIFEAEPQNICSTNDLVTFLRQSFVLLLNPKSPYRAPSIRGTILSSNNTQNSSHLLLAGGTAPVPIRNTFSASHFTQNGYIHPQDVTRNFKLDALIGLEKIDENFHKHTFVKFLQN